MSKKTWIIFAAVCVALLAGLVYLSSKDKVDLSNVDTNAVQPASVQSGNIGDHIIGILHIHDLLTLDSKRSTTAEKAMEARVFYIREDQTLAHALAAFLRTRHHLFIVVNEFRETVGVLSLEDVMEALLGHKIIDEFDAHEDLRAVAARNIRANNHPVKREDV